MSLSMRFVAALLLTSFFALTCLPAPGAAAPSGPPVRIGSTLALTGPLAPNGIIHKIAGEIFVEEINKRNGLLGRPVEWILFDDQSKPDQTRTLYERLISVDKVDLLMGPYATAAILSAMAVAQRYQKLLISNTFGVPSLSKYEMHFPVAAGGPEPERTWPATLFDALGSTGKPPKTVAIVTSKFPSVYFISVGARDLAVKRGMNVVLYLEYDIGNRDFGPIAARVKEASPDFLWAGVLGVEGNMLLEALKKIDYTPRGHFYLFPASGPLVRAPEARFALANTVFEEHAAYAERPGAAEFIKLYNERAAKASLPYTKVDQHAALGYVEWQVLEAAVTATKSLDDRVLAQWLKRNRVDTLVGRLRWDGPTNFGEDLYSIRQVQDGRWVVVWPKEWAAPAVKIIYPTP